RSATTSALFPYTTLFRSCRPSRGPAALRGRPSRRRSGRSSARPLRRPRTTRAPSRDTSGTPRTRSRAGSACPRLAPARAPLAPTDTNRPDCPRAGAGRGWSRGPDGSHLYSAARAAGDRETGVRPQTLVAESARGHDDGAVAGRGGPVLGHVHVERGGRATSRAVAR